MRLKNQRVIYAPTLLSTPQSRELRCDGNRPRKSFLKTEPCSSRDQSRLALGSGYWIDPTGIRTPVHGLKGRCPRPLDDGAVEPLSIAATHQESSSAPATRRAAIPGRS